MLVSGGLDSCVLLSWLLGHGRTVQPLYVRSGLVWEGAEQKALRRYLETQRTDHLRPLVVLESPLSDIYGDHWSVTGCQSPDRNSLDKAVFLPGRNVTLVTKSAIWCQLNEIVELALAPLKNSPFRDASHSFFQRLSGIFDDCGGPEVRLVVPFAEHTKQQVMRLGKELPLRHTFSCLAPVTEIHCGECNKCAERQTAFADAGLEDPTLYAMKARSL